MRKKYCVLLMMILAFGMVVGIFNHRTINASADIIIIIDSDTTWTKANSPYTLTGPLLVKEGVTLTITAGSIVNINDYEIRVNGTLRAIGTNTDKIQFTGIKEIEFTETSKGWNDQTNTGCIIDNVNLGDLWISSINPIKITNSETTGNIKIENSSIVSNNMIGGRLQVGHSSTITNNEIAHDFEAKDSCYISNNNFDQQFSIGSSCTLESNNINGHIETSHSIIRNNILKAGIDGESNQILNNIIYDGGNIYTVFGISYNPPVEVKGISIVSKNTIYGKDNSFGILVNSDSISTLISENIIIGAYAGIEARGDAIIEGNLILENRYGIYYYNNDVEIRNNTISNNFGGIKNADDKGSAIIELNLIKNNKWNAIDINTQATIQNNTISNNPIGVETLSNSFSLLIHYNNIEDYSQNSVYLRNPNNVDAVNNWWGTIDLQEIDLSIYDSKFDFDVGTVTFEPILTLPNSNALPNSNPAAPAPNPTPTPTSTPSPNPTPTPIATPTSTPTNSPTPTTPIEIEAILGASIIIALLGVGIVFFLYLMKKK